MSLGTDYEVFVTNTQTGTIIPAIGFQLGGKTGPHRDLHYEGQIVGSVHRDNLMLELCSPPADTAQQFACNLTQLAKATDEFIRCLAAVYGVSRSAAATFSPSVLATPEARDIGCDADYVSVPGNSMVRERLTADTLLGTRFAGGHIHISYDVSLAPPWVAAMLCDLVIGAPAAPKLNAQRAEFYGLATLHRPTIYPNGERGVEYRVLDNFWVHGPDMSVLENAERVQALLQPVNARILRPLVDLHTRLMIPNVPLVRQPLLDIVQHETQTLITAMAPDLIVH